MTFIKALILCLPLVAAAGHAHAQDEFSLPQPQAGMRTTFYIGAGKANTDDAFDNDDTPFSIGVMHQMNSRKLVFGFDIGREGTVIDSTWGLDDEPKQAMSYNLLIGGNMIDTGRYRADAALLLGMRESFADCPDSYLGFQCYADSEPETDYKGNFGGVITLSVDGFTVGLRATGESTQVLAGFRF